MDKWKTNQSKVFDNLEQLESQQQQQQHHHGGDIPKNTVANLSFMSSNGNNSSEEGNIKLLKKTLENSLHPIYKKNSIVGTYINSPVNQHLQTPHLHTYDENINNWNNIENLRTIFGWITISALNIECLDEAITYYRKFITYGTIMCLFFSTASGTISSTSFGQNISLDTTMYLNILFTFFSFAIASFTGIIKIFQIQEKLETFIRLKQEWILFSATISSELQLPIEMRTPILIIIKGYKNKFLDLLKTDLEIPNFIKQKIIKNIKVREEERFNNNQYDELRYSDAYSLSDVIIEMGSQEFKRIIKALIPASSYTEENESSQPEKEKKEVTQKDLQKIYDEFALINKNFNNMNIIMNKKHRVRRKHKKHTISKKSYTNTNTNDTDESSNSVSDMCKSIISGTIRNSIIDISRKNESDISLLTENIDTERTVRDHDRDGKTLIRSPTSIL